jgi:hypothetical protein
MLGGLLGLVLALALATGAGAVCTPCPGTGATCTVTDCGDYSNFAAAGCNPASPTPSNSFIQGNDIASTSVSGTCIILPKNATYNGQGHKVSSNQGPDAPTTGISCPSGDCFIWKVLVKGFGTCIAGDDDVAVEEVITNQCAVGIRLAHRYKVKEVRLHDCRSSDGLDTGMILGQGGFIESSIVRSCDFGVFTGENNKIWNLVVTRHTRHALEVAGGNAVSRTVISTPRSINTEGLIYRCSGSGCADDSNSVQDHLPGLNIIVSGVVITTGGSNPNTSRTNCGGLPGPYNPATGQLSTC